MTNVNGRRLSYLVTLVLALVSFPTQAQTFTTVVNFDGSSGAYPEAPLAQGLNGSLYGTTQFGGLGGSCITGGLPGCGTVFEIAVSGQLTTLYNFCSENNCADGNEPVTGLGWR